MPATATYSASRSASGRKQVSETARKHLATTIRKIENRHIVLEEGIDQIRIPLGIRQIDTALDPADGRGIIANALHEIRVETSLNSASGAGFALCLGQLIANGIRQQNRKTASLIAEDQPPCPPLPVFWISDNFTRSEYGNFYGPGLAAFGLLPENLIRIHPASREETLWAAGEIAATKGATSLCLIEIRGHPREIDLTATRRLMLRAQASQTPVILLRQSGSEEASAAATRWLVGPAHSNQSDWQDFRKAPEPLMRQFIGPPAFSTVLEKCRGGNANQTTRWNVEWKPNDQCFALVKSGASPVCTRQPDQRAGYPAKALIRNLVSSTSGQQGHYHQEPGETLSGDPPAQIAY